MSLEPAPVLLAVSVVFARADGYWTISAALPEGATVGDVLRHLRDEPEMLHVQAEIAGLAIFGQIVDEDTRLHDGDRVELLRALVADAKQARRERAQPAKRRS